MNQFKNLVKLGTPADVQEALTNSLKHAGATRITVSSEVDLARGAAVIRVADDGRGFEGGRDPNVEWESLSPAVDPMKNATATRTR